MRELAARCSVCPALLAAVVMGVEGRWAEGRQLKAVGLRKR